MGSSILGRPAASGQRPALYLRSDVRCCILLIQGGGGGGGGDAAARSFSSTGTVPPAAAMTFTTAAVAGRTPPQLLLQGRESSGALQDLHGKRQPPWVGGRVSGEPQPRRVWRRRFLQAAAAAAAAADTGVSQQQQQQQQQHVPAHGVELAAILLNTDHLPVLSPIGCCLFLK